VSLLPGSINDEGRELGAAAQKRLTQMREVCVGDLRYRIVVMQRDTRFVAHAERVDTGGRFGMECAGASEQEACVRLVRWLEWQREHVAALEALRRAEQAYYRTVAGSAFGYPLEDPSPAELQTESLEQVEAARVALDEIRARRPE
jgi:hypothetical protein